MHYSSYLKNVKQTNSEAVAGDIDKTVKSFVKKYISDFDYMSRDTGLLLGNVQSGKTGHMFGILAAAADKGFEIFVVLTTDNTHLQQQTLERAFKSFDTLCVCGETDDLRFSANDMRKPVVLVIKKNHRILETWKNNLGSSKFLNGRPIFIVDDEGDAASLNTNVNKDSADASTVNKKILEIIKLSNSSLLLQVTATPQSLFLQEKHTDFKPKFVYYFEPGKGYLGGNFFYSTAKKDDEIEIPYPIRFTAEDELSELRESELQIPEGMQKALSCFLITAAHIHLLKQRSSCNFLIHPSVSINDHDSIANSIGQALNTILSSFNDDDFFKSELKNAWFDLKRTQPNTFDFYKCYQYISKMLECGEVNVVTINSKSKIDCDYNIGSNIIIGGNSLGRGVTFPNLQITYYCRKSKIPQADTFWQHCRAFGYDREPGLTRIFLPASLFILFSELNEANNAMIEYINQNAVDQIKLIYPKRVMPTRKSVIKKDKFEIIAGGVNYFPNFPSDKNTGKIDELIGGYSQDKDCHIVSRDLIIKLLKLCPSDKFQEWNNSEFIDCILSLEDKVTQNAILIVRRDRNISKGTGTLLSPTDRKLGALHSSNIVLTLYRVIGEKNKGWNGSPVWIPNIKLPKGKFFHGIVG